MLNRLTKYLFLLTLVAAFAPTAQAAQMESSVSLAQRCEQIQHWDLSNITDASTQITSSKLVKSTREMIGDLNEVGMSPLVRAGVAEKDIGTVQPYCLVTGYVTPNVSNIGFQLWLPVEHWNGKFLHVGCGGWCGTTDNVGVDCAKHPGYACIGSDMGHIGGWTGRQGGIWMRNNLQAEIDFSYRATHVATLAGKAMTERFYSTKPRKSYFMGCSTGGYQAMTEAQRFPWDFDGIVAGAPDMDEADLAMRGIWVQQHFMGRDGRSVLSPEEIQWVHQAALAKCDLDDGVKDGIIGDPVHCKFDPAELLCKGSKTAHCLSASQVQAVKNIYGAPVTSQGMRLSSRGPFPGSENNWMEWFVHTWGDEYFTDSGLLTPTGREFRYTDFDFDRDYARIGIGELFEDTNPDLRRFKAAGGKLIAYEGGNDVEEIPWAVFDYYEMVEKTMGGRAATRDFFRLFTIPGMDHCTGGDGPFAVDYLSYLEAWVEQGKAPDMMVGAHPDKLQPDEGYVLKFPLDSSVHVAFTRPLYPYPQYARYKGEGDPNRAENFAPATPGESERR